MAAIKIFRKLFPPRTVSVLNKINFTNARYKLCSTASSDQKYIEDEANYDDDIKKKILKASLEYVAKEGWTVESLKLGAESQGYPSTTHAIFTNGAFDLVDYFYKDCNKRLNSNMREQIEKSEEAGDKIKVGPFIRHNVEVRLRMIEPYIDSWPQAITIMSIPTNFPQSFDNLVRIMDDIWYHAGDRSHDMTWYSKRLLLLSVYESTMFCMLQDKSVNFEDTWKFLDRRLADVKYLGECTQGVFDIFDTVTTTFKILSHSQK